MNLSYSLSEIAFHTNGTLFTGREKPVSIKEILIDSRRLVHPESTLFVAIVSGRNDGHRYIAELFEKGVRNFLVSALPHQFESQPENENEPGKTSSLANFILVDNTLEALQKLGAAHRSRFSIPVIGITGSNGKTIVKEWLFQLMNRDKKIVRSPKSYNSQIGVPLSVWKMEPENDLALFEAGISLPGEMEKLEPIIRPTIGIFANIGHAHDEGFRDLDQKVGEKLKLFVNSGTLVYCMDHELIHAKVIQETSLKQVTKFTWSRKQESDLQIIRSSSCRSLETILTGIFKNREITVTIPFTDEASIENAIHCWALMLLLGYEAEVISARMKVLVPIAMRLELKEAINRCSLVNDSYNSDINSLGIAIDFLNQQTQHTKKTVILSDILQVAVTRIAFTVKSPASSVAKGYPGSSASGMRSAGSQDNFPWKKHFLRPQTSFSIVFPFLPYGMRRFC